MKTATLIKTTGQRALYRLSEPLGYGSPGDPAWDYVISSHAFVSGTDEVYLFGSDENGVIQDWMELPGSRKECVNLDIPLQSVGYEVIR